MNMLSKQVSTSRVHRTVSPRLFSVVKKLQQNYKNYQKKYFKNSSLLRKIQIQVLTSVKFYGFVNLVVAGHEAHEMIENMKSVQKAADAGDNNHSIR